MARVKTLAPRVALLEPTRLAQRATSGQRGYNYRWQQARARYLAANPLCALCRAEGRVTAARVVDHIVPHRGDVRLFWDVSNWQSCCEACHSAKTARQDGGFGNARG